MMKYTVLLLALFAVTMPASAQAQQAQRQFNNGYVSPSQVQAQQDAQELQQDATDGARQAQQDMLQDGAAQGPTTDDYAALAKVQGASDEQAQSTAAFEKAYADKAAAAQANALTQQQQAADAAAAAANPPPPQQ